MAGNTIEGGRNYIIPLLITLFVFWESKYKNIIFSIFCLLNISYVNIALIKSFVGVDLPGSKKIVIDNINPNHQLKFFYDPKFTEEDRIKFLNKFNVSLSYNQAPDNFNALIQMYKTFGLNDNDKVLIFDNFNYAPFILNSKFPNPSIHMIVINATIPQDSYMIGKIIEAADIIVVAENEKFYFDSIIGAAYTKAFEKYKNTDYFLFYKTDNLSFYAKRDWLKEHKIKSIL